MKTFKIIMIAVGVILLVGAIVFIIGGNNKTSAPSVTNDNVSSQASSNDSTDVVVSAAELAVHNKKEDCWTSVNGLVYDITEYIPKHPGGDEILLACGTDGTSLFTERQTSDGDKIGSGTPHSSSASKQLEAYKIGTLATD